MSWRDALRPGSFRGVAFEAHRHVERGRARGAHYVYPMRDRGWVEALGLDDDRLTLTAFVIGEDYMSRRDALRNALKEPGAGELIHPWLGPMTVVVDPSAGWTIEEDDRRGRMARFALSFLAADDQATYPSGATDGRAATDAAAAGLADDAPTIFGQRIDLSGAAIFLEDVGAVFETALSALDGVRAIAGGVNDLGDQLFAATIGVIARARASIEGALAIGDLPGAFAAYFDSISLLLGGPGRAETGDRLSGVRPPAKRPSVRRSGEAAGRAATALRIALDGIGAPPVGTGSDRLVANRGAALSAIELALLAQLARASVESDYDGHEKAISAMRDLDARIDLAIFREADRSDADDRVVRRLGDLRGAAREALLAAAVDLPRIERRRFGESLPTLAVAWRVHASTEGEADIIARNGIVHPLWAPASLEVRGAA